MSHVATVTIDHTKVDADLTDYVVAVIPNGAAGWAALYAAATESGGDLRIYKSDDVTELARELVSFSVIAETGEIHIKYSGTLSSTVDTDIHFYADGTSSDYAVTATYGRNNVWTGFNAVYHFNEASGTRTNSTGGTDLSQTGTVNSATGKIGNGFVQVDSSNYLNGADGSTFDISPDLSMSVWVYNTTAPSANTEQAIITKDTAGASQRSYTLNYNDASGTKQLRVGVSASGNFSSNSVYSAISQTLTADTWFKLRGQFNSANANASKISYFVNGSNLGNGTMLVNTGTVTTIYNSTTNFRPAIYDSDTTRFPFIGRMDELRLKAGLVSNGWETTEYNNQNSPTTFYSVAAVSGSTNYTKDLNETVTVADLVIRDITRSFTEGATITDAVNSLKVLLIELADSITITDTLRRAVSKIVNETATIADTIQKQIARTLSEVATITTTATALTATYIKEILETVTVTTSFSRTVGYVRSFTEGINITDRLRSALNGINAAWSDLYSDTADAWSDLYHDN